MFGYWMPFVRCKTPSCSRGKPTFLPYPNPPEVSSNRPLWPTDAWQPFLICRHCELGYEYTKQDVEWRSSPIADLSPELSVLDIEVRCVQNNCEFPVKLYLSADSATTKRDRDRKIESGCRKATCRAGHGVLLPLDIRKVGIASEIK